MTSYLRVIQTPAGSSLQDKGRHHVQRFGVETGGAMDFFALNEGAALLDNHIDDAALELSGIGARYRAEGGPLWVAVTGATVAIQVNERYHPPRSVFMLAPNDTLTLSTPRQGFYTYLHVRGGFHVAKVLGSHSTSLRAKFGGLQGRMLQNNDLLAVLPQQITAARTLPTPGYFGRKVIRVVLGTQSHLFPTDTLRRFFATEFIVSSRRNRMGVQLDTNDRTYATANGLKQVSEAVVLGDIQINGDGQATVLLADHQPTGGYPRIATVISADIDAFSQLPIMAQFRFTVVSHSDAVRALADYRSDIDALMRRRQVMTSAILTADLLRQNLIDGVVNALE